MFGVHKGGHATLFLDFGHSVQSKGGFTRGFRTENLDHTTDRQAADTESHIEAQRAGRDAFDLGDLTGLAEFHHRALAERTVDLGDSCL